MKVKSVSDLAFKTLDKITADEDELWVAHAIFNNEASRTGEIQKLMKKDGSVAYSAVQGVLKTLVEKEVIIRVHQGKYAPNLKMILKGMIEILEEEGGKINVHTR